MNLPEEIRAKAVELLNPRLADCIDLVMIFRNLMRKTITPRRTD
jgi:hypothetical protein